MSLERRRLMLAYGASFDLTPREKGMKGAIERARELVDQTPGAWMPQQFENLANLEVHRRTTVPGDLSDFRDTPIDVLVTGVGTGGHITACAELLKQEWPQLQVFAVEPTLSPVLSGGQPGRTRSRDRRGLRAGDHEHQPDRRRDPGRSQRCQGDGPPRRARGRHAGRHQLGRDAAGDQAEAGRDRPGKRVLGFNYDSGERYLSVPDFLPE
jgi:cysteine synthase A